MPDTRNEQLALAMGWTKRHVEDPMFAWDFVWVSPDGQEFDPDKLPDFANDHRAAVEWMLPFLWEKELRVDFATAATGVLLTLTVRKALKQKPWKFNDKTISLALAGAVEAQKGGG